MKNLIVILILFMGSTIQAQTYKLYQTENIHNQLRLNTKTGEVYQIQSDGQRFLVHLADTPNNEREGRFKLYKTENLWTYILLDTYTGIIWQCQYSVGSENQNGSWIINPFELTSPEKKRFSLSPMTSMYQFYLINEDTGEMWKIQWSTKGDEYRWIEKY